MGEPECNGVAERFIRTLKEECIYLHNFETLEEARAVIGAFRRALQQQLAPPAPRVHDPGPRPREAQPKSGLMYKPSTCPRNPDRYRFDELLERLRNLERFLAGQKTNAEKVTEDDLPF